MGFLNDAVYGLLNFFYFMKEMKNSDLWILVQVALPNFSIFTKILKNLDFLNSPYFHLLSDSEDSLSGTECVLKREGQFMIKLPFFKKINIHIYALICVSLSDGSTISKFTREQKLKHFPRATSRLPSCFRKNPHLFAKASFCSIFITCNNTFRTFEKRRFFFFGDRSWRYIFSF